MLPCAASSASSAAASCAKKPKISTMRPQRHRAPTMTAARIRGAISRGGNNPGDRAADVEAVEAQAEGAQAADAGRVTTAVGVRSVDQGFAAIAKSCVIVAT